MLVTLQLCLLRFGVNFASHMISLDVTIVFTVVWCESCISCDFSSCYFLVMP